MITRRIAFVPLLAALSFAPLISCGGDAPPPAQPGTLQYTENARLAYQRGLHAYADGDWEEATTRFQEVRSTYAQSRYARLAELRLADIAFEQDKLTEAVGAYKSFIKAHRHDPGAVYAHYRVCRGLFLQINDTILLPPQEERDQGTVSDAYRELRRFVRDYPDSKWNEDVRYMLASVSGRLVRHELYVARFYLRLDNYDATVARVQYALRNFDGSGLEAEAMVLLGETYLKMKKRKEARETFERVLAMHGDSPFILPARSFLNEMDATEK